MPPIRGRFRTSRIARKAYCVATLLGMGIWASMTIADFMSPASLEATQLSIYKDTTEASARRHLLSSGAEIIPGFTGAMCGSNWYYVAPSYRGGELTTTTVKVAHSVWSSYNTSIKTEPLAGAYSKTTCYTDAESLECAVAMMAEGQTPKAYASWESQSGGILYVILSVYLFLGIAIICDGGFTDSLEMICSKYGLDIPPDVAGATFMAAGSSAPELATSFLGVFVAASPVGLGTILGSAVFNILIIVGAVAVLSTEPLNLDYRPVVRDNFFYAISVILLCSLLAADDQANLVDAILLLLWYCLYILFLAFNETIMNKLAPYPARKVTVDPEVTEEVTQEEEDFDAIDDLDNPLAAQGIGILMPTCMPSEEEAKDKGEWGRKDDEGVQKEGEGSEKTEGGRAEEKEKEKEEEEKEEEEKEEEEAPSVLDKVVGVLSAPYEMLFMITMPECHLEGEDDITQDDLWQAAYDAADPQRRKEMKAEIYASLSCPQKWFWATFFISLVHISWLSYFMVEFMLKIGCIWQIPDVVMGLTFLAMGTSIPDALGSISVAQDGEGDMAVSNAVGSNVFDICMGLGLPWFIKLVLDAGEYCNYIPIFNASNDVIPSIIILLVIIVVLFSVFLGGKWVLYPKSGFVLFAVYSMFVVYQLLNTFVINPDAKDCVFSNNPAIGDLCC